MPRRRFRDDLDERDHPTSNQVEKYINEIHSDFSKFANKYHFVMKDNDILKEKLDNIEDDKY